MLREEARRVIEHWETGGSPDSESLRRRLRRVNEGAERLEAEVYAEACRWLDAGKTVGVVGGEHSVPLGPSPRGIRGSAFCTSTRMPT